MSPQPPAILHAIDTTGPGGAETVFLQLVEQLKFDGVNNFAVIKGPGWVEDQLKQRGIDYLIVKPRGFLALPYYWQLLQILRKRNVRLIQANLLGSTLTYSILALLLRIPLVATLHGRVDVNPNERLLALKNLLMRWGVTQLVAVSRDLAQYIEKRKLFAQNRIAIIYNGIDTARYGRTELNTLRSALKLSTDAILVGSVGNVRPAKAYDVLIEAANIVLKRFPNVHFVIAGHQKPDLMATLASSIDRLNQASHIHFLGFHHNSAEFLGQMDYFVLSSSSEGFSIATIEAMATGLPVVATRCGGPEEILQDQVTGLLVPTANPEQLAAALVGLIDQPDKAQALAQAGQEHVRATFSAGVMFDRYRAIYQQLWPALRGGT